ncbi:MAG TPA: hypothetical protein VJR92_15345 [Gemmatimonadaceae bacterium]|nr:hypothetical protein [Gemmatimonadaceae bacterium]
MGRSILHSGMDAHKPSALTPRQVLREFLELTDGGSRIRCVGAAKRNPKRLLALGYVPKYKIELFGVAYYLCDVRKNVDLRFMVAYIAIHEGRARTPNVYARILYKDGSLLWRSASHYAKSAYENWIGKGDVKYEIEDGDEYCVSAEHTTDLPLEMQPAMEEIAQRTANVRVDTRAVSLVVRRSNDNRLVAYRDFTEPRRRAAINKKNLVNGGKPIARFTRKSDPTSLVFVRGYEPDFSKRGLLDVSSSYSRLYGGTVRRYRIASRNKRMQYLFCAAQHLVWIGYPQSFTTELSRYGVRTIDVAVPDDLVVPGMEYHYLESDDPPVWMSQIPDGYAGPVSPNDPWRADASAWLDKLPVIRAFRRYFRAPSSR